MKKIRIQTIKALNHNVRRLVTDKPEGYDFKPGQATLVAVDKDGLREEKRKDLSLKDNLEVYTKGRLLLTFTEETRSKVRRKGVSIKIS